MDEEIEVTADLEEEEERQEVEEQPFEYEGLLFVK